MDIDFSNKRNDSPILSVFIFIALLVGSPISLYVLFTRWAESPQRLAVAVLGILTITAFLCVRKKYEVLIAALLFFSQFKMSLHSIALDAPVNLQFLFIDIIFALFLVGGVERRERLRPDGVGWLFILLISWQLIISFLHSAHVQRSLLFVLWQLKYLVVYLFVRNLELTDSFARQIKRIAFLVLLIQGALAIVQQISGATLGLSVLGEQDASRLFFVEGGLRVSGTLGATNALAGYLAMLLVLCLPFLLRKQGNLIYYGAYGAGCAGLLFALSRAGWLAFMVGTGAVLFCMLRTGMIRPSRVMVFGLLGLMAVSTAVMVYRDRIESRFENKEAVASALGRFHQLNEAWPIIERYPLLGIGPGVTEFYGAWNENEKFVRKRLPLVRLSNQPHSSQLQYWIESGTPGFCLFMLVLLMVAITVLEISRNFKEASEPSMLRIGASAAALAAMTHASFGTEINNPQIVMTFWILFALARNRSVAVPADQRVHAIRMRSEAYKQ